MTSHDLTPRPPLQTGEGEVTARVDRCLLSYLIEKLLIKTQLKFPLSKLERGLGG